jgi:hypothetical protein
MRIALNDRRAWWLTLLLLCAVLVVPFLLVEVPPLLDYPNHLARMVVLASPHDPILSLFARPRWGIIPDLGIDVVLPPLLHLLPVHVAGRIVVAFIVLLPVLGAVAYSRAAFGQCSWWALGVSLVAYNEPLLLGFLNFTASLGLALLLAAAWITWRDTRPALIAAATAVGAIVIFFCHLMGLVCLAVLLSAFEAERIWRRSPPMLPNAARSFAMLAAVFGAPVFLYARSPFAPVGGDTEFRSLHDKILALLVPFINYHLTLDIITAIAVAVFVAACLLTRLCRFAAGSSIAIAVFLLLFAVAPGAAKGGQNIDIRFIVMAALLLFAGILPQRLPRMMAFGCAAVFVGLFAARMTILAMVWHASAADIADLRSIITAVPPGSAVFIASVTPEETPQYWNNAPRWRRLSNGQREDIHMPALLMIERRAFWPFLFDEISQQPIEKRLKYRILGERANPIPDLADFARLDTVDLHGFNYLLLLDAGGAKNLVNLAPCRLAMISRTDFVALYRVRPQSLDCNGP